MPKSYDVKLRRPILLQEVVVPEVALGDVKITLHEGEPPLPADIVEVSAEEYSRAPGPDAFTPVKGVFSNVPLVDERGREIGRVTLRGDHATAIIADDATIAELRRAERGQTFSVGYRVDEPRPRTDAELGDEARAWFRKMEAAGLLKTDEEE